MNSQPNKIVPMDAAGDPPMISSPEFPNVTTDPTKTSPNSTPKPKTPDSPNIPTTSCTNHS